ncbi:hypothetical protein CND05650 [Cryptococcus deneoformans JEC21]|uniref:Uncharacterized protein n=2 Tax=Cryptococcus deneoformans TaxID=40410 RepID=Q5KHQ7_CRYD1|nr:hypothetical protein CND05650 [Cryptococcus neoformans var. neoformans JEC21]AAV98478.1 g2431 [Cryptococcus neoformans var. neoformans]AAV98487.1 g2421 [Cryptococcus neoformans var. neoformans]AAW42821.2 hypothetical protein CND05650 [Cryptococcus neoformans var. neoformans JEC21]
MWALSMLYRYEIPLAVAGLVLVRWLPALLSPRSCPTPPAPAPLPRPAKLLLLLSSLHRLHLLLFPPFHLFTHHNIPILAHNTLLRDALETDNGPSPLADLLLARLKVLDNRYLYARLGHRPLLECLWCTRPADYFLFALPSVLWPYLCDAVVLGMLSWRAVGGAWAGRRAERWRGVMAWVLLGAAVGEIGVKWGWDVVAVEGDCVHVAPAIHTVRSLFLLLLPIVYVLLPLPAPPAHRPSPSTIMPYLASLQSTLHYTSVTRTAISHSSQLRTAAQAVSKRDSEYADKVRKDDAVWASAREAGVDEDGIRRQVRVMLKNGWERLMRLAEL